MAAVKTWRATRGTWGKASGGGTDGMCRNQHAGSAVRRCGVVVLSACSTGNGTTRGVAFHKRKAPERV